MKNITVGIVGAGYWGPKLVRNFHDLPDVTVKFVCDKQLDRLSHIQTLYPDIPVTLDFDDLLSADIDAIVVATPVGTHYTLAKAALLAGKNVLVEKPLTACAAEADIITRLASERQLILMTGHTFIYNPAVKVLKEIVQSGEIGDVYYINATRVNLGIFQTDINVLWDLAPHDLSILLYVLEMDPVTVSARGGAYVQPGIHDVAYLTVNFPNDVMADVRVSWLDPNKIRSITIVGSKRMIVYDDLEPKEKIRIYDKGVDKPPYSDTFEQFKLSYRYGDVIAPEIPSDEPLRCECDHFVTCIREGTRPLTNGKVGLQVVQILETAQKSLLNGGERVRIYDQPLVSQR